ncbi:MAG: DNA polymerase III subunit delta [Trueperaceae bacterium]|nr:DNA polymerase III subunit delta [Trueperaceae bacterium]
MSPVRAFVGDPFLARRAARAALDAARERAGVAADAIVRLGEGSSAVEVADALGQGGLFGPAVLWLDLDEAFVGAGHTAARNAVLDALEVAGDADVVVLDASATPARQKRWRALGELVALPTPRYAGLARWVAQELKEAGVAVRGDVAGALADAFGDDLPGLAGEVVKLALLGEPVTPERALEVAHRPAARSAFDVVDALAAGDAARALGLVRGLLAQGEAPVRVHAALAWHVELVARCTALALRDPSVTKDEAARALGTSPYPTGRALEVARRLDEPTLAAAVRATVAADVGMKTGRDPEWALESCVLTLVATLGARVRGRA